MNFLAHKQSIVDPLVKVFFTKISPERIADITALSSSGEDFMDRIFNDEEGFNAFNAIAYSIYRNWWPKQRAHYGMSGEEYTVNDCVSEIACCMLKKGNSLNQAMTPGETAAFICMWAEQHVRRQMLKYLNVGGLTIKRKNGKQDVQNYSKKLIPSTTSEVDMEIEIEDDIDNAESDGEDMNFKQEDEISHGEIESSDTATTPIILSKDIEDENEEKHGKFVKFSRRINGTAENDDALNYIEGILSRENLYGTKKEKQQEVKKKNVKDNKSMPWVGNKRSKNIEHYMNSISKVAF